jgi:uncharacterized BrkB/YihY/UPF0761 family membrane protein
MPGRLTTRARGAASAVPRWADNRPQQSLSGVGVAWWRRYRAIDGPFHSALLSLYILVAIVPALLVLESHLERSPAAFANRLAHHLGFSTETARLLRDVLGQVGTHELGSALLAVAGALFFGLAMGRVLQVVHTSAWGLPREETGGDQLRYALVLLGLYGLLLVFFLQLKALAGGARWDGFAVAPGWMALLTAYFTWAGRTLTHGRVSTRDLMRGTVIAGVGVVVLMIVSRWVLELWVNLYAADYGGFGVVMAFFFWIAFSAFTVVASATLAPVLAERRRA